VRALGTGDRRVLSEVGLGLVGAALVANLRSVVSLSVLLVIATALVTGGLPVAVVEDLPLRQR
jgi:hypothetical protein